MSRLSIRFTGVLSRDSCAVSCRYRHGQVSRRLRFHLKLLSDQLASQLLGKLKSHSLITHNMNIYITFLTSTLDGCVWWASRSCNFILQERSLGNRRIEGWADVSTRRNYAEKRRLAVSAANYTRIPRSFRL